MADVGSGFSIYQTRFIRGFILDTRTHSDVIFIFVAFTCIIAILKLQPPLRNYVPILWVLYGFVLNGSLYIFYFLKINKRLTGEYSELLKQLHIGTYYYHGNNSKKVISTFTLMRNKFLKDSVDDEIRNWLQKLKLNFIFTIVGFVLFGLFGILTVMVSTGK